MLDTMLMWRGEAAAPGREPVDQAHAGLEAEDQRLGRHAGGDEADALASSRFSIGHIAIGVALGYIDFRFPELAWRNGHPRLAALVRGVLRRGPSVKANEPMDEP